MLLPLHLNGLNLDSATAVVALTGTATAGLTEAQVDSGGATFIWTLTNDTFLAAGTGPIGSTANTQALIDNIVSDGAESLGWNNIRSNIAVTDVVRTSDTVATLTLPALPTHEITSDETLTSTVPADVLTGGSPLVASQTVTISADARKGGRSSSRRRFYVVEVDGEQIAAQNLSEAQAILQQAVEVAKISAPKDVRKVQARPKTPRVTVKTGAGKRTTSQVLQRQISTAQSKIQAIYRKAFEEIQQERELSERIQRRIKRQKDDEEAVTLLFL